MYLASASKQPVSDQGLHHIQLHGLQDHDHNLAAQILEAQDLLEQCAIGRLSYAPSQVAGA